MAEIFNFYVQDNRSIQFPKANLLEPIMQEDYKVATWRFRIPKVLNGIDMSAWAWWFVYVNAKNEKFSELLTLVDDIDEPDSYSTADYDIDYGISYNPGSFSFSLEAINAESGGVITGEWHTKTYAHKVDKTLQGNQVEYAETESDVISALMQEVRNKVNQLVGGAIPEPVSLIADMTDTSKVYLYVGSETGESTNYWYYYNGSAWVAGGLYASGIVVDSVPTQGSNNAVSSGGVYEALQNIDVTTDTTLSVLGKPADAKAVGDALADKVDASELDALDEQMAMVITKTPKPAPVPTEITQCVDLTSAKVDGSHYYNVKIETPWIGRYDMNPSNQNMHFWYMKAYDKDGNKLNLYRDGSAWTTMSSESGGYFVKTDARTIKTYEAGSTTPWWTWTADGDIAYLYNPSNYGGYLGDVTESGQLIGVTFAGSSETYVPYEPIDPDVPVEYDYSPNTDFADSIQEYYATNGFINSTFDVNGAFADAKAVGDELYNRKGITFETVHGWIRRGDGALITGSGYTATDYIPVTPGETIRVNRPALQGVTDNAFYNASKGFVSALTTPSNINDITIPSGAYYVRFSDQNAGMVGFTVERTGLWTRIHDAIEESGGEAEYRNLIEQSRYGTKVLTLLHFSDLHMDATTMGYINAFRTKYAEFIDDVIQTGDVSNGFSNDWSTLVSVGLGDCLGVIGNHEALGNSKNSATQQELHEKYIEPYISGWNVTQPTGVDDSTSEHYCANYYYKDYTSATVRLIVLDTQKWSSAQLTWFTSVLASARTAGYAVVVASHVLPGAVTITDCNFSAKYASGGNVTHAFPTSDAPLATEDAVSAVNDFITAGGEFTIWIGGHEHADIFGVFTNYPNVTVYMIDKASIERETPGAARIRGEKNQHAFNIMSLVRDGKLVKFVRIGEDVDGMMRGKHVFCYNYNTKTIISQW